MYSETESVTLTMPTSQVQRQTHSHVITLFALEKGHPNEKTPQCSNGETLDVHPLLQGSSHSVIFHCVWLVGKPINLPRLSRYSSQRVSQRQQQKLDLGIPFTHIKGPG